MNFKRSVIIAELWRSEVSSKTLKFLIIFCVFWKNDPLR